MLQRTALAGVVVSALLAAATPAQANPTPTPTASTSPTGQADAKAVPPQTITLLTGDKVTLRRLPAGQTQFDVKPAPGRERITFLHRRSGDGISVVPWTRCPSWPKAASTPGCSTSPGSPNSATTTTPARRCR